MSKGCIIQKGSTHIGLHTSRRQGDLGQKYLHFFLNLYGKGPVFFMIPSVFKKTTKKRITCILNNDDLHGTINQGDTLNHFCQNIAQLH